MQHEWSTEDLIASWTLVGEDWELVGNKAGLTRLGFALLLKFFEIESRFPQVKNEVPSEAVVYVARQGGVDPEEFDRYDWDGRAIERHRMQIRAAFGFRMFTRADEDKLAGWLTREVCPVELRDDQLRQALLVRCRAERLEPPGRVDRSSVPPALPLSRHFATAPSPGSAKCLPSGSKTSPTMTCWSS
ncbi:DUF4158 domain-containing protein [Hoyosella sp. YIM 151337]|uniref:DUF4158 domain-containing protein n=1 Tax=Hoyosella sp. YIM 151337 TaxID=2992742 RepID=UPI0022363F4E|nr:DUF4158 domain-containing protein [Hoyosella sp. YIM 151337]MCW4354112.1 DUF4158 domain-containing protein [Hoyosella sp. YIM 151337]